MDRHAPIRRMFRNEFEFVTWVQGQATGKARGLRAGIGDDAALVQMSPGHEVILKTDLSVEGVHFSSQLHPARSVGHRALARALSDIAAMGGIPKYALISLALARRTPRAWIEEFYDGLLALAARFRVALVGGDTTRVPGKTLIDAIVVGEVRHGRELLRSGAKPGHRIFVSGRLGLAALGLDVLKQLGATRQRGHTTREPPAPKNVELRAALRAHLYPEPCCALGLHLSDHGLASAAIDLSDGLSTDLNHLCEASGVGACVWEDRIPLAGSPRHSRARLLQFALRGGEDYQLLFTVPPAKASRIPSELAGTLLSAIGEIRKPKRVVLVRSTGKQVMLEPWGYDHFKES